VVSRSRGERGYALLTALFVLFLLAIALELVATALLLRLRAARAEAEATALAALSDAALAESLAHLAADPAYRGAAAHPYGGGAIGSRVEFLGVGRFEVRAAAGFAGRLRVVRAVVARGGGGAWVLSWARVAPWGNELE
jgi:type II secretory pathway pseudopilin PulG